VSAARIDRGEFSLLLHALDGEHARAVLREAVCPVHFPDDMWTAKPAVLLACVARLFMRDPATAFEGAKAARIREAVTALAVQYDRAGMRVRR
jgi:hypothetical protein